MILKVSRRSFLIVREKEREENRVNGHVVIQHISIMNNDE